VPFAAAAWSGINEGDMTEQGTRGKKGRNLVSEKAYNVNEKEGSMRGGVVIKRGDETGEKKGPSTSVDRNSR